MNLGFVSTRFAGTDGVSLETTKWSTILRRQGHNTFFCAGALDEEHQPGMLVPEMHFAHPTVRALHDAAFGLRPMPEDFSVLMEGMVNSLLGALKQFQAEYRLDVLIIQNALAIPMHLPLGVALARFLAETGMPAIAHHHDFYWERSRFAHCAVPQLLRSTFPPDLPNVVHVVINSAAQRDLQARFGISSTVVPNVFDFSRAAPGITPHNSDLRTSLGLSDEHLLVLQPTRVVRRKGIELSLELVRGLRRRKRRLRGKEPVLLISHPAGDEGFDYFNHLQKLARRWRVPLFYAADRFHPNAVATEGVKYYSLWDAYVHADFVTYPSLYEGFGNALLEAIYFRLPVLVNRYSVYNQDIAPLGFDLIEIDGAVDDEVVDKVIEVLCDPVRHRRMVEHNYEVARSHFSYEAIAPTLAALVEKAANSSPTPLPQG